MHKKRKIRWLGTPAFGFSLLELLVAMGVLALLIVLIAQLFTSAQGLVENGSKQMDADAQARAVFDRMAIDFAQIIRRPDVDCFLKDRDHPQPGNDQLAFFGQVRGYPGEDSYSSVSLVAYRINAAAQMERLGCGLPWNGQGGQPMVFLPFKISDVCPNATTSASDDDYELAGPEVFRMEYYYVIKSAASNPSILSSLPWDARAPTSHSAVKGYRDVAAIGVVVAVIDPKSRKLVSSTDLNRLAQRLSDFPETDSSGNNAAKPGDLEADWQKAVTASDLPRAAASSIRIYRRWFPLSTVSSLNP